MKHVATPAAVAAAKACSAARTIPVCLAAQEVYTIGLMLPYIASGYNVYDMRERCKVPPLCYDFSNIDTFLNTPRVKAYLNVTKRWTSCDKGVQIGMLGDFMRSYQDFIPDLLAGGIKVLVYAGDQDFICNFLGCKAWALALEWAGKQAFNAAADEPWTVDGREAGKVRSSGGLTFLQLYAAGHMVPMDQPGPALAMLNHFVGAAR
jgi:carboxypeptidase C (cathepsin A)